MLKKQLSKAPLYVLAIYASLLIFLLYTCCYAYRKPFTAALYEGEMLFGFDLKILYVLSEIIGYALSKFIGVHILPSMQKHQRVYYIIGLLTFSELSWLGFGFLPVSLKLVCVFFSGLPLGMIWGVVFSYIEGRRISEVLNVGLSVALIVSSGLVKTLGQYVLDHFQVTEYWMPFVTGAVVYPIMLICTYLLNQIPEPDEQDKLQRTERAPMGGREKKRFFKQFFWGICMLILLYASLTVFRELRDSFAADVWKELQISGAMIFTRTEAPIAFFVLALMFTIVFIRNNRLALNIIYVISVVGGLITVSSTLLYVNGYLSPINWMIFSGLGMYMGYIPFTYLIERLIASLQVVSTAIFVIYLADSFGYLGTAGVFMIKNFSSFDISWVTMLVYTACISAVISILAVLVTYVYFKRQLNNLTLISEEK